MQMCCQMNILGRSFYKQRADPEHQVHKEDEEASKTYKQTLEQTKHSHWRDWLEWATDPDIWTINKVLTASATDRAKARIPSLKYKQGNEDKTATSNTEKAQALARSLFPAKPVNTGVPEDFPYPNVCCKADQLTKEQILHHISKLKLYKAPGPNSIPNIILSKCSNLLIDRLCHIYRAILDNGLYYVPWKEFHMVVLHKPGKPHNDTPKAYCPIALLCMMWKVLTATVAEQITYYTENHNLLPAHHFGGRPGHTTTDVVHLLMHWIKSEWRRGNVTSVLFLDVEGAFPNAVPAILVHNLRKRKILQKYINFVAGMLEGRTTHLKFDDFTSDPINIDNRIGQGDLLSMVLYQYYNADILNIPTQPEESAIAYIDNALIMALAKNFMLTHKILANMMTREGGINKWSTTHNSPLELSKLALIDFAHRAAQREHPVLLLPNIMVKPSESTKYLGIMVDQHLKWKVHQSYAIEKGSKWAVQIRRAMRPAWGIMPKYARHLYIGVALPRILYGADVWCSVPQGNHSQTTERGTAKVLRKLASIQRTGALDITGALWTSPTNMLNACTFLPLISYMLENWCQRAAIHLVTIPPKHPVYALVKASSKCYIKKHRSPLHTIFKGFKHDVRKVEKIPTRPCNPEKRGKLPFTISIPDSKEASMEEDCMAKETIRVYSDISAINGKVGSAAVLTQVASAQRTLHFHLGPEGEHTVHEAELISILLAIQLIKTECMVSVPIAIGADNQAALGAFTTNLRSLAHSITRETIRQATFLLTKPARMQETPAGALMDCRA